MKRDAKGRFVSGEPDWLHGNYDDLKYSLVCDSEPDAPDLRTQKEHDMVTLGYLDRGQERRAAELTLLDVDNLDDFREARAALPLLVTSRSTDFNEMPISDYRAMRERNQRSVLSQLKAGEMTFDDFLSVRRERNGTETVSDYKANRERERQMLNGQPKADDEMTVEDFEKMRQQTA